MADQPAPAAPAPKDPALVGREREQAALRDALAAALSGRGSLVLIGGEAGIGKTALAESVCGEAAGRGALVLVGRCYDLTETPPYGPWAEALGRLVPPPAVLPALSGEVAVASQAALFGRVREDLAGRAAQQPLVAVLDDLHWADPGSLDLLRALARTLAALPLLLLATYRADELTRRHPLYALLPTLVREARATRLELQPLDEAGLAALVRAQYGLPPGEEARLVAYLRQHAEGNPFYAGELLRALAETRTLTAADERWRLGDLAGARVPPLLRQVIDARLDRLGEGARGLLAVAAVIGQELPLGLWAAVAGTEEEALLDLVERAAEARVLTATAEGARFAHALIREALYEGILPPRLRALHRRAAEALLAAPQPDPDAVADHFQRAGDPRAWEWLVAAGERAYRAWAWPTAVARFEAALALLDGRDEPRERGWLLERLARLTIHADTRRGLAYLEAALPLLAAARDDALAASVHFFRGLMRAGNDIGQYGDALAEMAAGVDALEALAPAPRHRLAVADRAFLPNRRGSLIGFLSMAGRYAEALAMGERYLAAALAASGALPPASGYGQAYQGLGNAHAGLGNAHAALGHPAAARDAYGRGAAAQQAIGSHPERAYVLAFEIAFLLLPYAADRPAERRGRAAEVAAALAQVSGVVVGNAALSLLFPLLLVEGRWAEAQRLVREGVHPTLRIWTAGWRAVLAHARGEADLARGLVREWLPAGSATRPGDQAIFTALPLLRVAAALARDDGDHAAAQTWLAAHDRWLAWSGAVLWRAEGALGWAEYYRATGDEAAARDHAGRALAHASEPRQPLALLAARRTLGELAIDAGRHGEAAEQLHAALALADACAAPYERALTLLALAELHTAAGHRAGAEGALAEARALLQPLEAAPALARAEALAAHLAAVPAPQAHALPFGLTAREAEVLRLVVAGLTNPQVADRLFVTPRTVNGHLTAVYTKLGVEGRAAAIRVALDHGLR